MKKGRFDYWRGKTNYWGRKDELMKELRFDYWRRKDELIKKDGTEEGWHCWREGTYRQHRGWRWRWVWLPNRCGRGRRRPSQCHPAQPSPPPQTCTSDKKKNISIKTLITSNWNTTTTTIVHGHVFSCFYSLFCLSPFFQVRRNSICVLRLLLGEVGG